MTRLVLLHSPLLGPSSWRAVAAELERQGVSAETPAWPRLSTLGEDCYAALAGAMAATIDAKGREPAVLVAHSGAGALIPSVAALARTPVAGVVFCDALLPHPGRSWFETAPPDLRGRLRAMDQDGWLPPWDRWWPPGALERLLSDERTRMALLAELEPVPTEYFDELAPDLEMTAPGAYLQLSAASTHEARRADRHGWPVASLPLHHLAMMTHAEAVAGAILQLAARLEGARHG